MRIELNLASRPTENRRRFYVLVGTGAAVLLALALLQGTAFFRDWWSGRDLARQTERLRAETLRLETEQRKLELQLRLPEVRYVLDRSYFLNSLILQKSVSWTQIFMDLEKLMPDRVQVLSIHPEMLDGRQIRLDMSVAGESMGQLLELLRRIEKSDKFNNPVLSSEQPPPVGGQDPSIRLTLTVLYAQKQ